jgi:probable phosphoglycerate mutase
LLKGDGSRRSLYRYLPVQEIVFWLIRHAESTWNAAGRWQGQEDPPLSERGRRQAAGLARALGSEGVETLITSDLARAFETASIVGRLLGLRPRTEPALRELDAGVWNGLPRSEIARRDAEALALFDTGDMAAPAGGGESRRDAARRARRALLAIGRENAGRRLAVVTHGGVIRSLLPGVRVANAEWHVAPLDEIAGADGAGS